MLVTTYYESSCCFAWGKSITTRTTIIIIIHHAAKCYGSLCTYESVLRKTHTKTTTTRVLMKEVSLDSECKCERLLVLKL